MSEYLKIKEFANLAGVSPQAIYQRLDQDLKPYLKTLKGVKTLKSQALELFSLKGKVDQVEEQEHQERLNNQENQVDQAAYIENLLLEAVYLREMNTKLMDDLSKERDHSRMQAAQLAEITKNAQLLLAMEKPRKHRRWWPFGSSMEV